MKQIWSRFLDVLLLVSTSLFTWWAIRAIITPMLQHNTHLAHWNPSFLATIVVVSVLGHELGHAFFMERYGLRTRIFLLVFIGGAVIDPKKMAKLSWSKQSNILLAGVCVNFLLGVIGLLLGLFGIITISTASMFALVNGSMIIWNLIPVGLFDGGRLAKLLFNSIPEHDDLRVARYLSRAVLPAFIGLFACAVIDMIIPMTLMVWGFGYQATHDDPEGSYNPLAMTREDVSRLSWIYLLLVYGGAALLLLFELVRK
ncbi:MAG: site-2 protease family protein [Candidatus Komeilibacteria bacterium]